MCIEISVVCVISVGSSHIARPRTYKWQGKGSFSFLSISDFVSLLFFKKFNIFGIIMCDRIIFILAQDANARIFAKKDREIYI